MIDQHRDIILKTTRSSKQEDVFKLAKYIVVDTDIEVELSESITVSHKFYNYVSGTERNVDIDVISLENLVNELGNNFCSHIHEICRSTYSDVRIHFNKGFLELFPVINFEQERWLKQDYKIDLKLTNGNNIIELLNCVITSVDTESLSITMDYLRLLK